MKKTRKIQIERVINSRAKILQEESRLKVEGWWDTAQDVGQGALGVVGMIPGVGNIADLANAGWSAGRGNYGDAALNLAAAVPGAGLAVGGASLLNKGKNAYKGIKAVDKVTDIAGGAKGAYDASKAAVQPTSGNMAKGMTKGVKGLATKKLSGGSIKPAGGNMA